LEVLLSEPGSTGARSPHSAADVELARLARALAHPARVRIVRLLDKRGACGCGQIVLDLPLAQATVSQHLKVLKQAGIIRGQVNGPRVCYRLDPKALKRVKELLGGL
jgi:ArsR family transcriptional regulator